MLPDPASNSETTTTKRINTNVAILFVEFQACGCKIRQIYSKIKHIQSLYSLSWINAKSTKIGPTFTNQTLNDLQMLLCLKDYKICWLFKSCRNRAKQRVMHQIWDWAKNHNRHSSKSIRVTKLSFCQNDSPMSRLFQQNNRLITLILFELCLL